MGLHQCGYLVCLLLMTMTNSWAEEGRDQSENPPFQTQAGFQNGEGVQHLDSQNELFHLDFDEVEDGAYTVLSEGRVANDFSSANPIPVGPPEFQVIQGELIALRNVTQTFEDAAQDCADLHSTLYLPVRASVINELIASKLSQPMWVYALKIAKDTFANSDGHTLPRELETDSFNLLDFSLETTFAKKIPCYLFDLSNGKFGRPLGAGCIGKHAYVCKRNNQSLVAETLKYLENEEKIKLFENYQRNLVASHSNLKELLTTVWDSAPSVSHDAIKSTLIDLPPILDPPALDMSTDLAVQVELHRLQDMSNFLLVLNRTLLRDYFVVSKSEWRGQKKLYLSPQNSRVPGAFSVKSLAEKIIPLIKEEMLSYVLGNIQGTMDHSQGRIFAGVDQKENSFWQRLRKEIPAFINKTLAKLPENNHTSTLLQDLRKDLSLFNEIPSLFELLATTIGVIAGVLSIVNLALIYWPKLQGCCVSCAACCERRDPVPPRKRTYKKKKDTSKASKAAPKKQKAKTKKTKSKSKSKKSSESESGRESSAESASEVNQIELLPSAPEQVEMIQYQPYPSQNPTPSYVYVVDPETHHRGIERGYRRSISRHSLPDEADLQLLEAFRPNKAVRFMEE